MTQIFSTRRNALAFVALYVAISLAFIVQRTFAWIDADSSQNAARQELLTLTKHMAINTPLAALGRNVRFAAESETRAIAQFDALFRKTIAAAGGVVVSTQSERRNDAPHRQSITMSAIFRGNIDVVQRALYQLEIGTPTIVIEKLAMDPQDAERSSNNPVLNVSLSMSARWSKTR